MFVSQVIFESEKENKEMINRIMKKKMEDTVDAEGLVSAETWIKPGEDNYGFALVTKWQSKDDFKQWMAKSHAGGHKGGNKEGGQKLNITKVGYQFEIME